MMSKKAIRVVTLAIVVIIVVTNVTCAIAYL